ncbi:hypothetical protein [Actinomadura sp. NPDC048394]|uniref:hypothetical protein n=1 Tax=Actinomadura sp. NPDC048394 TaxID=3158223 RepID=UPI0033E83521
MTARLGLSSGSAPGLDAPEFAALVRRAGGTVADLRAGKGHRWEEQGLAGLCGLPVSFVGISVTLGRPGRDGEAAERFPGESVKVFAAPGALDADATAGQMRALTADRKPEQVLVETHRGGAGPDELVRLCERYGCRLVLDNLGLDDIAADFRGALGDLAPLTAAVQVKGFEPDRAHRPLTEGDLGWLAAFRNARVDVTVESRAGTPHQDLRVLRTAWEAVECA